MSSYFGKIARPTGLTILNEGMKDMLGQIEKIHYLDIPTNLSKQFVEYDVSVRNELGGQSVFRNIRSMATMASSVNNYGETILEANNHAVKGKLDTSNFFKNKNGTMVVVSFLNGSLDKPYISSLATHPRFEGGLKADGVRKRSEFNGIYEEIDKDGAWTLEYSGNRETDGKLARPDTAGTVIKIDKEGILTLLDNAGNEFQLDRTSTKISLTANGAATTEWDGDNKKVTLTAADTGATTEWDGANNKVTLKAGDGAVTTEWDGASETYNTKTASGAGIKFVGGEVAIGNSTTEVLDELSKTLGHLIVFCTSAAPHAHTGNLGFPTPNPVTAPWDTLKTALLAIQVLINALKGSL